MRRGFTLIELIIAGTIAAMIAGTLAASFSNPATLGSLLDAGSMLRSVPMPPWKPCDVKLCRWFGPMTSSTPISSLKTMAVKKPTLMN